MLESELAKLLNDGRRIDGMESGNPDVDAGGVALCRMYCNAVRPGKPCEDRCQGEVDPGIFHSTHMKRMRSHAAAVIDAVEKLKHLKGISHGSP